MDDLFFECRECRHKSHQRRPDGTKICLNCKLVSPADMIHGYTIIATAPAPGGQGTRHGRVLLIDKGADHSNAHSRWITAWQGRDLLAPNTGWDAEWGWGHYFGDRSEADKDFEMRKARGY